jgi:hypothetical protein
MYGIQDFIKAVYEHKTYGAWGINFDYLRETQNFFTGCDAETDRDCDGGCHYMFNKHTGELVGWGHFRELPDGRYEELTSSKRIRLTYEVLEDDPEDLEDDPDDFEDDLE